MPRIIVRFFGPAADESGAAEKSYTVAESTTLGQFAGLLAAEFERLGVQPGVRLAVNRQYVALDRALVEGDEVAVIPPVSGG